MTQETMIPDNYTCGRLIDAISSGIKRLGKTKKTITIDDLESQFVKIEDDGLVRCIAQNFTTKWFKLYEKMEQLNCSSCNDVVFLGNDESKICYNDECGATL